MDMITAVTISDLHSLHGRFKKELLPADCLIIAGDIENSGQDISDIVSFATWLAGHKHKYEKIFLIAGNHDGCFYRNRKLCQEIITKEVENLIYLENEEYVFKGFKFYGSPITPTFFDWYFMADRGPNIKQYWDAIPDDVNVLITHGPRMGILDEVVRPPGLHVGCEELAKRMDELKQLKLHVCGHTHCAAGEKEINNVIYINTSICTERYNPSQDPHYVTIFKD